MPSVTSISKQQYYAHPRNQFWPIVGRLFEIQPELSYAKRCKALLRKRVAVWDVLEQCAREGSADAAILASTAKPNDIAGLVAKGNGIRHIFFNGHKAQQLYQRHIEADEHPALQNIPSTRLPSTSPANAATSLEGKLKAWKLLAEMVSS